MDLNGIPVIMIPLRDGIYLSNIRETDKAALCKYLQAKEIHDNTLTIPHPYHESDAEEWLRLRLDHNLRVGAEVSLAIRNRNDEMIGSVGADNLEPGSSHRGELGYWLAVPYWGRGIMTDALRAYINYAFEQLQVTRLVANVFESNLASSRVLERSGFKLEGRLRQHYLKNGRLMDARVYGLLKDEAEGRQ